MRRDDIPLPVTYGSVCSESEVDTGALRPQGWRDGAAVITIRVFVGVFRPGKRPYYLGVAGPSIEPGPHQEHRNFLLVSVESSHDRRESAAYHARRRYEVPMGVIQRQVGIPTENSFTPINVCATNRERCGDAFGQQRYRRQLWSCPHGDAGYNVGAVAHRVPRVRIDDRQPLDANLETLSNLHQLEEDVSSGNSGEIECFAFTFSSFTSGNPNSSDQGSNGADRSDPSAPIRFTQVKFEPDYYEVDAKEYRAYPELHPGGLKKFRDCHKGIIACTTH